MEQQPTPPDTAVMHKEAVLKEDGRTLIYYRFTPAADAPDEAR